MNFYTLDIGYSFIVEAARLAFPSLPDNHLRALALQLVADVALLFFVFFLFSQWNMALGLVASYLYASDGVFLNLVSFAFYYYWDIPFTFVVLGSLLLAYRRPEQAGVWLTLMGAALGVGVWMRGSWWPIALFLFALAGVTPQLRKKMVYAVVIFAVIAAPQVIRASRARGHLDVLDASGLARGPGRSRLLSEPIRPGTERRGDFQADQGQKYGVDFRVEDYWVHDQAAKKEFFAIWNKDKRFVIGRFSAACGSRCAARPRRASCPFCF